MRERTPLRSRIDDGTTHRLEPASDGTPVTRVAVQIADGLPERGVGVSLGSKHKLVQHWLKFVEPPVEIILAQRAGATSEVAPVVGCACQLDPRNTATVEHEKTKVRLHAIHERDLKADEVGGRGRRERSLHDRPEFAILDERTNLGGEHRKDPLPGSSGR